MTTPVGPPPAGSARCCLDAMVCISFHGIGRLDLLNELFGTEVFLPRRVFEEWRGSKETGGVIDGVPSLRICEPRPEDGPVVARLHRRFGSVPPRNDGEAQLLAVCKRNPNWIAITEDQQGWEAARDLRIPKAYMVTVMAAAAAAHGLLTPSEAWKLHVEIEKWRQDHSRDGMRFSVMPYDDSLRLIFMQVHDAYRTRWIADGRPEWCDFLCTPGLDEALILALKRHR